MINPSFQGASGLFVLLFENANDRTVLTKCYLPTVEINNSNVMIDGKFFFDQPVKSSVRTYYNIRKLATGQEDYDATGYLLDYNYFNYYYKMITVDLSQQESIVTDPKAINFTGNLDRSEVATMFFIIEKAEEVILDFSQVNFKVLRMCSIILFCSNIISI